MCVYVSVSRLDLKWLKSLHLYTQTRQPVPDSESLRTPGAHSCIVIVYQCHVEADKAGELTNTSEREFGSEVKGVHNEQPRDVQTKTKGRESCILSLHQINFYCPKYLVKLKLLHSPADPIIGTVPSSHQRWIPDPTLLLLTIVSLHTPLGSSTLLCQ